VKGTVTGQFTRYSLSTIATQFLVLAVSAVTSIIIARVLGPEGRGQLSLLLLVPAVATTFGRLGIGHAVNYYASKVPKTKLIINSFIVSASLSVLLVAVALPVVYFTKDIFFKTIGAKFLLLICLAIPLYVWNNHFVFLLQGLYKINHRNLVVLSQAVFDIVLIVILVVTLGLGLIGAVVATILSFVLVNFLSALCLLKQIDLKEIHLDLNLIKQLVNFGIKTHIGNIMKDLAYREDILIISYFLSVASVGYYVAAVLVAEAVWGIPDAVGNVLLARVSAMERETVGIFASQVCRRLLIPVAVICVAVLVFAKKIILVAFGASFEPSVQVLMLLLPGILSFSMWKVLANVLIAQGYPTQYSVTSGVTLFVKIAFDLLLVPKLGINGAAIGSSLAYIMGTIFIVSIYTKVTRTKAKNLFIPAKSDIVFYKDVLLSLPWPNGWRLYVEQKNRTCPKT
jgi:O-antigen/teichoic acid export membrane protein